MFYEVLQEAAATAGAKGLEYSVVASPYSPLYLMGLAARLVDSGDSEIDGKVNLYLKSAPSGYCSLKTGWTSRGHMNWQAPVPYPLYDPMKIKLWVARLEIGDKYELSVLLANKEELV